MKHFVLLTIIACFVGCSGTAGTQARSVAITGPEGETTYSSYINADNSRLARRIAVVRLDRADIGGLVKAAVSLQSRTEDTEAIQYKWTWFDSKGFEVSSASQPWQPLLVYGMQATSVQGLAPNPSAKDFKLHIRYQE
jgi:uncharacterized protein YcfL